MKIALDPYILRRIPLPDLDIGQGEVDWDVFFRTLAQVGFDGIATVCVFAWEERARESAVSNLEQVRGYLAKYGGAG
jgi:myo-inositol catabolism protein IolH